MGRGSNKTATSQASSEAILYGRAPKVKDATAAQALKRAFRQLQKQESDLLENSSDSLIWDDTSGRPPVSPESGKRYWQRVTERDDIILNKLQTDGIVAVWFLDLDGRSSAVKEKMISCAAQLGIRADDLAFAEWKHQEADCLAMSVQK